MEAEKDWIFTFGCDNINKGHFVRIHGTFSGAREKMCEKFGDKWASQYSEEEWDEWNKRLPSYFVRETELYVEGLSKEKKTKEINDDLGDEIKKILNNHSIRILNEIRTEIEQTYLDDAAMQEYTVEECLRIIDRCVREIGG